jgi:hypothetical protein
MATLEQRDEWFMEKSETRSRKRKATSPLEDGSGIDSLRDVIAVDDEEEDVSCLNRFPMFTMEHESLDLRICQDFDVKDRKEKSARTELYILCY